MTRSYSAERNGKLPFKSKYDTYSDTTTQPAEVPAGVVSETQENTEDPLAGLPQQEAKTTSLTLGNYGMFLRITVTTLLTATLTNEWKLTR